MDTTLTDFTDMKCQRGDLSFIFNGNAVPAESFVVLDNEQKVYQRIHHEVGKAASKARPTSFPAPSRPPWSLHHEGNPPVIWLEESTID